MSLLVNETYANPTAPLWVSSNTTILTPSNVPKIRDGTGDPSTFTFPNTAELVFHNYTDPSPPSVIGQYVITMTGNFRVLATGTPTSVQAGVRSMSGTTMQSITFLTSPAGEDVAGSVVMTWPYSLGDLPSFDFFAQVSDDNSTSASIAAGWSIVFYPN